MSEPLTIEETAVLDALDTMPARVIAILRSRLSGVVRMGRTRTNMHAALDRLLEEFEADEIEVIEERERRVVRRYDHDR